MQLGRGIARRDLILISDRTAVSLHWLISGLPPSDHEAIWARARQSLARFQLETWCGGADRLAARPAESV